MRCLVLLAAGLIAGWAAPAGAACSDPPAPQVNWLHCAMDGENFAGADLKGAVLRDASFFRTDLSGAALARADGYRAKFVRATLAGAQLDGARLTESDFTGADLARASLRDTDLRRARLDHANLRGADLKGARLEGADLAHCDLSGATWVDGRQCAEASEGSCREAPGDYLPLTCRARRVGGRRRARR